jgi:hypothetical protein
VREQHIDRLSHRPFTCFWQPWPTHRA